MFKLGNIDFSNRVIAGTYAVQNTDVYNSWTDCNYVEHRDKVRERMEGSFDVLFLTIEEFNDFMSALKSNKRTGVYYSNVTLKDNYSNTDNVIDAYITMTPIRDRKPDWTDYMQPFTVTVKER